MLSTLQINTDIFAAVYETRVLNFCEFRQDNNDLPPTIVVSGPNDQSEGQSEAEMKQRPSTRRAKPPRHVAEL